jgi:hypothetical protein
VTFYGAASTACLKSAKLNWNTFIVITGRRNLAAGRVADVRKFGEAFYRWAISIRWTNDLRDRNKAFLENSPK